MRIAMPWLAVSDSILKNLEQNLLALNQGKSFLVPSKDLGLGLLIQLPIIVSQTVCKTLYLSHQ